MKKIVFAVFVATVLLFSCTRLKNVTDVVNNEELPVNATEVKREIKSIDDIAYYPIDESRDIFNGLFDDIKDDNYNEWGDGFTVTHFMKQGGPNSIDKEWIQHEMYVIENNTIKLYFYNSSELIINRFVRERLEAQKKRLTGFIPLYITIKKNTNEYRLGNYIGKNISEVLNDFDNQYSKTDDYYHEGQILFYFELNDRYTKQRIMRVNFYTFDNIIKEIRYGYSIPL